MRAQRAPRPPVSFAGKVARSENVRPAVAPARSPATPAPRLEHLPPLGIPAALPLHLARALQAELAQRAALHGRPRQSAPPSDDRDLARFKNSRLAFHDSPPDSVEDPRRATCRGS